MLSAGPTCGITSAGDCGLAKDRRQRAAGGADEAGFDAEMQSSSSPSDRHRRAL
jgi:hypothetical protein